jgi:hypothetical protein
LNEKENAWKFISLFFDSIGKKLSGNFLLISNNRHSIHWKSFRHILLIRNEGFLFSALAVLLVLASPLVNAFSPPEDCDCSGISAQLKGLPEREMMNRIRQIHMEQRDKMEEEGFDREKLFCQSHCLKMEMRKMPE